MRKGNEREKENRRYIVRRKCKLNFIRQKGKKRQREKDYKRERNEERGSEVEKVKTCERL